jgi:signal transduction histidine kinase
MSGSSQRLSPFPSRIYNSLAAWIRRSIRLLEIPAPEAQQWIRRITIMERQLMLPIKAAGIIMIYSIYFASWIQAVHTEFDIEVEVVQSFFWVYVGVNAVAAALLLYMRRLPLALMQWVVFVLILTDGMFLSALTLVTGGYHSFLYWLFLALIVRSAVSVPRATSQILLNLAIIACFVLAGTVEISIAKSLQEHYRADAARRRLLGRAAYLKGRPEWFTPAQTNRNLPLPATPWDEPEPSVVEADEEVAKDLLGLTGTVDNPTEPLLMRALLLLILTACAYSIQVLVERQREAEEEAHEFGMREGQLRSAGRLAAEFAHQIKNPLAIINNAAYSLQRALKDRKPEISEQLRIIQEEVERSDRMITQVMGYAQLSEGRVEKLDVIEELDHAVQRVFPAGTDFGVALHRQYGASFPPLLMQKRHVAETFINLLQNARDALNSDKGNVWISAECQSDYAIEVTIRDNGPGIPPDKLDKIFEPYYTTKPKGTGVGLATVKHNVELYGGTVRVESELGKGARFIVRFPGKTIIRLTRTV